MSPLSEKTILAFERLFKGMGTMTDEEAQILACRLDEMLRWYATLDVEDERH